MLTYSEDLRKHSVQRQEFRDCISNAATYRRWFRGILNAFKYGITNLHSAN